MRSWCNWFPVHPDHVSCASWRHLRGPGILCTRTLYQVYSADIYEDLVSPVSCALAMYPADIFEYLVSPVTCVSCRRLGGPGVASILCTLTPYPADIYKDLVSSVSCLSGPHILCILQTSTRTWCPRYSVYPDLISCVSCRHIRGPGVPGVGRPGRAGDVCP